MIKGAEGVWTANVGPLAPEIWSYDFLPRAGDRHLRSVKPGNQTGAAGFADQLTADSGEGSADINTFDRLALLTEWVEKGTAPGKSIKVTAAERSLPMCSYPEYPKYIKGPPEAAESWQCSAR